MALFLLIHDIGQAIFFTQNRLDGMKTKTIHPAIKNGLLLLLFNPIIITFAQLDRGSVLLNFQGSGNHSKSEYYIPDSPNNVSNRYKNNSYFLSLDLQYFLKNNFSIGIGTGVNYNFNQSEDINGVNNTLSKQEIISIPSIVNFNWYIKIVEKFKLFTSIQYSYCKGKSQTSFSLGSNTTSQTKLNLTQNLLNYNLGALYYLKKRFAIKLGITLINCQNNKWQNAQGYRTSESNIINFSALNPYFIFGLNYSFIPKN